MPRAIIEFERASNRLNIDAAKATTLNSHSAGVLRGALIIAAERYEENRDMFAKLIDAKPPEPDEESEGFAVLGYPTGAVAQSLSLQFGRQADDVRALLNLLDGDDEAEEDTAVIFVAEGLHG